MCAQPFFEKSFQGVLGSFFDPGQLPWMWLEQLEPALEAFFTQNGLSVPEVPSPALVIKGDVHIHSSVVLPAYGTLEGPLYIGSGTQLKAGAYLRGPLVVGDNCVLGHCSEIKASVFLSGAYAPHFNYVGDSVLGNHARLGAGAVLANLRFDEASVTVRTPQGRIDTGRRKCGSFLGDGVRVGCNAVLQPGTLLQPATLYVGR